MGRYYSGDIEGKFWFAVQTSDDAGFFGGEESEPNYISYYFNKEHLKNIKAGLDKCRKALGKYRAKFDKFFNEGGKGYEGYNNEMLVKEFNIPYIKIHELMIWYARLGLGIKIYKKVKENGSCEFEAEL